MDMRIPVSSDLRSISMLAVRSDDLAQHVQTTSCLGTNANASKGLALYAGSTNDNVPDKREIPGRD